MKSIYWKNVTMSAAFALSAVLGLAAPGLALAEGNGQGGPEGSGVEVHITGNGNALVRGAKVVSVSGTDVSATTAFGPSTLSWIIHTDTSTQFVRRFGGASSVAEITAGDTISFSGPLATSSGLVVNAKIVKDWSILKTRSMLTGVVASINAGSSSFGLSTNNHGTVTVNVASSTILMKNGINILFSLLGIGDKVKASGTFDAQASTLAAERIDVNFAASTTADGSGHEGNDDHGKGNGGGFLKFWSDHFFKLNFGHK